ncbi:MAG: hypothetical protein ABI667_09300 [Sphingomicrobium sp.]
MSNPALLAALSRAERAIERIERAATASGDSHQREERLRSTVRDVVSELDSLLGGGR